MVLPPYCYTAILVSTCGKIGDFSAFYLIHIFSAALGELGGASFRFLPSRDPALPAAGHRALVIPVPG